MFAIDGVNNIPEIDKYLNGKTLWEYLETHKIVYVPTKENNLDNLDTELEFEDEILDEVNENTSYCIEFVHIPFRLVKAKQSINGQNGLANDYKNRPNDHNESINKRKQTIEIILNKNDLHLKKQKTFN